jgi:hypothetical protein
MQMRASPSATSKPRACHAAIIAFYALATVLVLNRLILGLSSYVSQGPLNDYHEFIWNNWWIGYALGTLHADPYFTNYVLYPFTHNLALHALTPILFRPMRCLSRSWDRSRR